MIRGSKMINNFTRSSFTVMLYLTLAQPSAASEPGFYAGVNIGNYQVEEQEIESSQKGIGFFGGYSFNKYIEVDISLFDAGNHENLGFEATGAILALRGKYPISHNWQLFGEVGGLFLDQDINEANTTRNDKGEVSLSDGNDSGSYFGFGAKYQFNDWDVIGRFGTADTDADFNIFTLGVAYKF